MKLSTQIFIPNFLCMHTKYLWVGEDGCVGCVEALGLPCVHIQSEMWVCWLANAEERGGEEEEV